MLCQKIQNDLKSAMKEKREFDLGVLRMLSASLKNREIEKRSSGQAPVLTDEDALQILSKEAKKRRDAANLYETGGREELRAREIKEAEFIEKYLPAKLSQEEIELTVKKVIDHEKSQGDLAAGDFGSIMKKAMSELKGQADGKAVGEIVKKLLQ